MSENTTERRHGLQRAGIVLVLLLTAAATVYMLWHHLVRAWIETASPDRLSAVAAAVWGGTVLVLLGLHRIGLMRARSAAKRTLANFAADTQQQFDALLAQTVGLAAVTLGWAVRAEMVRDDHEDIQEYMQQLAKRPNVLMALVATLGGQVIASSEPQGRGKALTELIADPQAGSPEVQIVPRSDGVLRLVIPVMGLEARLGTLFLDYRRPALDRPGTSSSPMLVAADAPRDQLLLRNT